MGFQVTFEIPFSDVDQHGVLHHPKYLNYLEQARIKLLDNLGLSYQLWIEQGYMLPVSELQIRYLAPLKMGQGFCVTIPKLELRARRAIHLFYTGYQGSSSNLVCEAVVKLICVKIQDNRVATIPHSWFTQLESYAEGLKSNT